MKNWVAKQQAEAQRREKAAYEQGRFDGFNGGVQAGFDFWTKVLQNTKGIGPVVMERLATQAGKMASEEITAGTAIGVGIKTMKRLHDINAALAALEPVGDAVGEAE